MNSQIWIVSLGEQTFVAGVKFSGPENSPRNDRQSSRQPPLQTETNPGTSETSPDNACRLVWALPPEIRINGKFANISKINN
jgi:hypothetical protein